eukprot:125437-Chlamydomonas_euryale.AAC.1
MGRMQSKAARSARIKASRATELPAGVERSPGLAAAFAHYCAAGVRAAPGASDGGAAPPGMSTQQLSRLCADIGLTGDGGEPAQAELL